MQLPTIFRVEYHRSTCHWAHSNLDKAIGSHSLHTPAGLHVECVYLLCTVHKLASPTGACYNFIRRIDILFIYLFLSIIYLFFDVELSMS